MVKSSLSMELGRPEISNLSQVIWLKFPTSGMLLSTEKDV